MTVANESTLSDDVERELDADLILSAPIGQQPESIPSCELYDYDLTELRSIAAGAIAGFYGRDKQNAQFYRRVLNGELSPDELEELRSARSRLSTARYDEVAS